MSLEDLGKSRQTPKPAKGPPGNIPLESITNAGVNNVPLSSRIIDGAKTISALGSPTGRHDNSPTNVVKKSPLAGAK